MQNTVMRQGKPQISRTAQEGGVVILLLAALGSHAGMAHDNRSVIRDTEPKFMRWHRMFVNVDAAIGIVGDLAWPRTQQPEWTVALSADGL